MALEEFWVRYVLKRIEVQPLFKKQMTEQEALNFYRTSDYMLLRNLIHRRHSAWRRVLWSMYRQPGGNFLEYGCGIAPISAWIQRRRPDWFYWLNDVQESPHYRYARWRIKKAESFGSNAGVADFADVLTLVDVLEHLPDPLIIAERAIKWLHPGGYLHWNFVGNDRQNDLDLASPQQRDETVAYLYKALDLVWEKDGYRVSRKR